MTDPLLLLVLGLICGAVVFAYWRVILAVLAIAALAVFTTGLVTVIDAVQTLTR